MYHSLDKFQISRSMPDGLHRWCKSCYSINRKNIRNAKKEHYSQYAISKYLGYKEAWLEFFIEYYGKIPFCSICDRELKWQSNISKFEEDLVCWDHASNDSKHLKIPPSTWLGSHACNDTNKQKWLSFKLGILCPRCNGFLPTEDRIEWLEKALQYAKSITSWA